MKIKDIINEDVEADKALAVINKYCQPYLSEVGGIDNALFKTPLYRGLTSFLHSDVAVADVKQDRRPLDTPLVVHDMINSWFYKKTGIYFRSTAAFCTGSWSVAHGFTKNDGPVAIVLPIGNYHYCWSKTYRDAYEDLGRFIVKYNKTAGSDKERTTAWLQKHPTKLDLFLNKGKYTLDLGLKSAIASGNEIMFSCKKLLLININWVNANDERLQNILKPKALKMPASGADFDDIKY